MPRLRLRISRALILRLLGLASFYRTPSQRLCPRPAYTPSAADVVSRTRRLPSLLPLAVLVPAQPALFSAF